MPETAPGILLNDQQSKAVNECEGPVLVVAGAGSGKTRVIVEKIHKLIEKGIKPYNILAITFTNKAANEMKQRVQIDGIDGAWISTFHSMSVRILRKEAVHLGLSEQFSIFDTDDQKSIVKSILKEMELDPDEWKPANIISMISQCKSAGTSAGTAEENAVHYRDRIMARIYTQYEKALKTNQALDFDDLLLKTMTLFNSHPSVLENYQNRFKYILVDEYQDTNNIQYQLIHALSQKSQGLTLTGDPDQSIYSWRGADINNILNFQRDFSSAKIIKLEENYRSTKCILNLSNQLIRHNTQRYPKDLNTKNEDGEFPLLHEVDSAEIESKTIAHLIAQKRAAGVPLHDIAIFYRTNAQSRHIEESLRNAGLPYIIIGGVRFFDRMEIKDLIAYLRFIFNPNDSVSLMRIINKPSRGISNATQAKIRTFADDNGLSCWDTLIHQEFIHSLKNKRSRTSVEKFNQMVADFFEHSYSSPDILLEKIIKSTEFLDMYKKKDGEIEQERIDNVKEFMSYAAEFCEKHRGANLSNLLEEIALVSDKKESAEDGEALVTMMTLHAAKGLEFPYVYIAGLDEGMLPHQRSIDMGTPEAIEEERRLCYVGLTRAQKELQLFHAKERFTFKGPRHFPASRFISEMQGDHLAICKGGKIKTPQTPISLFKKKTIKLHKGAAIKHPKFGKGVILDLKGKNASQKAKIYFDKCGEKNIMLEFEEIELL